MKIGIPREIKLDEYRVAITPAGVREMREHGHDVTIETGAGEGSAIADADYVTFTSSSTVRFFLESAGDALPSDARVVSIGPVTSATARELGLEIAVEAERHDPEGLVAALLADAT